MREKALPFAQAAEVAKTVASHGKKAKPWNEEVAAAARVFPSFLQRQDTAACTPFQTVNYKIKRRIL